ncbi:MAG: putative aminohydrolase SsnA [Spirochaetia bacterium]
MIALKNARIMEISPASIRETLDVIVEGSKIKDVGRGIAGKYSADTEIDCTGKLLMPGFVCGHNHFYSGLARGILADIPPSPDFVSRLQNLWWRLDRALDEESIIAGARICCLEAIAAGTTAVVDHHSSQSYIRGSLDILREGFEETGLRGVLCFETTDRNGREAMLAGVEENLRFARERGSTNTSGATSGGTEIPLIAGMIGGHAPFTLSDEALKLLGSAVEETGLGFHLHCAEDRFDPSHSHAVYGKDIVKRLDDYGLITERTLIAHGLYLQESEIDYLNERGAFLAHNPRSNMNNTVGYNHHLPDCFNVVLGTDGMGSDMLEELKFAFFKHQDDGGPLTPEDFTRMLFNGNRILETSFAERFGRVEPGCAADLVVTSYRPPTPLSAENSSGHMIFGMSSRDVETVIVNGKIVYRDKSFPGDVEDIYRRAREAAEELWRRL